MRLRARSLPCLVVALALAASLVPVQTRAQDPVEPTAPETGAFTRAKIDAEFGKAFDLVVLRPLGLAGLSVGAVLFVPAAALSAADPDSFEDAKELFLLHPAENVFSRRLGEF